MKSSKLFCTDRGGKPLLSQTFGVTADIAQKAFGDRLKTLEQTRESYGPKNRLLNAYFRSVLGVQAASAA